MNNVVDTDILSVAIIGNPNAGKSSLFNALTGMRQKVANYPGVTVEKKEGKILLQDGSEITLIDLPGIYSLTANSPDEIIAVNALFGLIEDTPQPDVVICVVDATNIERNLYLVSQIIDYHIPTVVALNMMDIAEQQGISIDDKKLSEELGIPVIPTVANKAIGIEELKSAIIQKSFHSNTRRWKLPPVLDTEWNELHEILQKECDFSEPRAYHEAMILLSSSGNLDEYRSRFQNSIIDHVSKDHQKLEFLGIDCQSAFIEARYEWIKKICERTVRSPKQKNVSLSDRLDRILTHKFWGFAIFLMLMALMFQAIFSWATVPMDYINTGFDWLGVQITHILPAGDLQHLLVNGVIGGVGAVVAFLPQILFLFLFLGLLEDTGYMARAAFIMDRVMRKVGLHGKSFIPLLSSFACAIPAIMATRTIENRKDRLVTMLVAPLMSCSARLPVYTLLIGAFIPHKVILGFFSLPGLTMIGLYLFGMIVALLMAWLFKKTLLTGDTPAFIMELPAYKMPSLRSVLLQMWERSMLFLKRAGTFILGVSIILWFLATYPKTDHGSSADQLEHSFAGQTGHIIEPLIKPLGFDWKIGIGLIASVLQREVFVSTMGTIYNIKDTDHNEGILSLRQHLEQDADPVTGKPTFTILTAICLMVYYVLAMQCLSTVAVMKRETNGWKWPFFQLAYMTGLAYSMTFIVYRIGLWVMQI